MKNLKTIFILFILVLITSCSKDSDEPATADTPLLVITAINPATGPKNTPVTITGTGFSTINASNAVTINGNVCPVINSTTTQLTITIPASAGSGKIKIIVADRNAESANFEFVVTTTVTTIAGSSQGLLDGQGSSAQFFQPKSIILDAQENLLITDGDRIRKVSPTGLVITVAGSSNGFLNGQGIVAKFNRVQGLAINGAGTMFVIDEDNHMVRIINSSGFVNTFAGSTIGFENGITSLAKLNNPVGIAIDEAATGTLYVADSKNRRIRKIAGIGMGTIAGNENISSIDGQGTAASFTLPQGITIDIGGNLYVTDNFQIIRKITPTGLVSTVAGSTNGGFADGQGSTAKFIKASGIVADSQGNLFVSDGTRIRKISPTGLVTTIAGSAIASFADGNAITAKFNSPNGITIDTQGNLYVIDALNYKIRKITFD